MNSIAAKELGGLTDTVAPPTVGRMHLRICVEVSNALCVHHHQLVGGTAGRGSQSEDDPSLTQTEILSNHLHSCGERPARHVHEQ